MMNRSFIKWTGVALAAGGVLTFLINAILTPLMPHGSPFAETAASTIFLWRQSASAVAVALLLFGSIGLYLLHAERAGYFGAVAFVIAFLGSVLVLAWEWVDLFVLRDLALRFPDALQKLEEGDDLNLYDFGAIIPLGMFTIGWIALAVSTFRNNIQSRRATILVIAGFFLIPLTAAILSEVWGLILGNLILGSGWFLLGHQLIKVSAIDRGAQPGAPILQPSA